MTTLKALTFDNSAESAWYHFTEAWLMLNGGLTMENLADARVVYDQQVDFSDKVHNHDGITSTPLSSGKVWKEHLNPNTCSVVWSSYFLPSGGMQMIASGLITIASTTADGSYFYGKTTFNYSYTTGDLDHVDLSSIDTAFSALPMKGAIASVPYAASTVSADWFSPVLYGTGDTPTGMAITTRVSKSSDVHFIGVFK
jgi:hypothetical protein